MGREHFSDTGLRPVQVLPGRRRVLIECRDEALEGIEDVLDPAARVVRVFTKKKSD